MKAARSIAGMKVAGYGTYCPGRPRLNPSFFNCSRSHWNFCQFVIVIGPV
jgi:hypothetical protein